LCSVQKRIAGLTLIVAPGR